MTERRLALIIATGKYASEILQPLPSTLEDARGLQRVLGDAALGQFEVTPLINQSAHETMGALEEFVTQSRPADLLYVHFSCHGLKDADGRLYFAASNTRTDRLFSTAISAVTLNDLMIKARSRRRVLVLDCCYGGAFLKGVLPRRADRRIGVAERFSGGQGFVLITASDALQYAFEGAVVNGKATPSVFTKHLLAGIESGKADEDGDGLIGVTELYRYINVSIAEELPEQRPEINNFSLQGEIFLAYSRNVSLQLPLAWEEAQAGGSRQVTVGERDVTVPIPPGIVDGYKRRYSGLGLPGDGTLPAGDLLVVFKVAPPPPNVALELERQRAARFRHAVLGPAQGLTSAARLLATLAEEAGADRTRLANLVAHLEAESEKLRLWRQNQRYYYSAKVEIRQRTQPLKPVLDRCTGRYAKILREREVGLRLAWHCRPSFQVSFDSEAVDILLSNLLDNASKYCFPHTTVIVGVKRPRPKEVAISVEDEGNSVPEDLRGEEFYSDLPYVNLDSLRLMPHQGLGLTMSAAIARAHGGRLSCRSEPIVGAGAPAGTPYRVRFTFALPLAQRSSGAESMTGEHGEPARRPGGRR